MIIAATCLRLGVLFMYELMSLVIAPLFVGLVILLVDHWLDD